MGVRGRRKLRLKKKQHRRESRLIGLQARPTKRDDQVYISGKPRNKEGPKRYHQAWCAAVNGVWLSGSNNLRVVSISEARALGLLECKLCACSPYDLIQAENHLNYIANYI